MNERHRRDAPFTPPESDGPSTVITVLLVVVTLFALYQGYEWLLERRALPPGVKPLASALMTAPLVVQPPVVVETPAPQNPSPGWIRCIVNGQVLYSDTHCPKGADSTRFVAAETPRPFPGTLTGVTTLFHCRAYSGGTFWANTHCNQHKALVDRMVNVPGSLPFDQQVQIAETQRPTAEVQQTVNVINNVVARPSPRDECKALDAQIHHWDDAARQPQSGATQDWIREQRKNARDRQFALRC